MRKYWYFALDDAEHFRPDNATGEQDSHALTGLGLYCLSTALKQVPITAIMKRTEQNRMFQPLVRMSLVALLSGACLRPAGRSFLRL